MNKHLKSLVPWFDFILKGYALVKMVAEIPKFFFQA
jgi:hypothetical protein